MAQSEVTQQVALLKAAFPRESLLPETIGIYVTKLSDIDSQLLATAVNRLIEESRFFPTIAEIRIMAARLAGLALPSPAETVALIRSADVQRAVYRRDGSFAYTEREWDWSRIPEQHQAFCQDVVAKVGDPIDTETDERRFGWDQSCQKVAESHAAHASINLLADLSRAQLPAHNQDAPALEGHGEPGDLATDAARRFEMSKAAGWKDTEREEADAAATRKRDELTQRLEMLREQAKVITAPTTE